MSPSSMLPSASARRKAIAGLAAAQATASKAPSEILPRLFLSSYTIAADEAQLRELGITHVVSVLEFPPTYSGDAPIKTLHIRIEDSFQTNILQHLDVTTAFIKDALEENEENKVLVHCLMGVSRSATVVCAYLIATNSMTANEAIAFVTKRRTIASPNIGFRSQLQIYSERFCKPEGNMTTVRRFTRSMFFSSKRMADEPPSPPPPADKTSKDTPSEA